MVDRILGGCPRRRGNKAGVGRRGAVESSPPRRQPTRGARRFGADAVTVRDDGCEITNDLLRANLSEAALELTAAGFAALWRGRTPETGELLSDRPDLARKVVAELVQSGRAEVDAAGELVGVHGITLRATRHHFVHAGRAHSTWCAFDSVGIPAALSLDATAQTDCPACGRPLTVEVRGGEASDEMLVLWLPAPDDRSNLINDFCASADLYCSEDHLRQRIEVEQSRGRVADLADALALGRDTWADVAGIAVIEP